MKHLTKTLRLSAHLLLPASNNFAHTPMKPYTNGLEAALNDYSISNWKSNPNLLALANDNQTLVDNAINALQRSYTTLGSNKYFTLYLERYFENDIHKLTAHLLAIMIEETNLNPRRGEGGEQGYLQVHCTSNINIIKEKRYPSLVKGRKVPSKKLDATELGVMMAMENYSVVMYSLNQGQYSDNINFSAEDKQAASFLFHNKGSLLFRAIRELSESSAETLVTRNDVLVYLASLSEGKPIYDIDRFPILDKVWHIPLIADGERLFPEGEKREAAGGFNYAINTPKILSYLGAME